MEGIPMKLADNRSTDGRDRVVRIWDELKRHLEQRSKDLSAEVRRYPTPIARCDDQLPKLIAQRDHVIRQLRSMAAIDTAAPEARVGQRGAMEEYLSATSGDPDDEIEGALRSRLARELAAGRPRR